MSEKKKKQENKEEKTKVKKGYTYFQVIGLQSDMGRALGKITSLYIPDMEEMNKLTPLVLAHIDVQKAYEVNRKKIIEDVDDTNPKPGKDDEIKEKEKARIKTLIDEGVCENEKDAIDHIKGEINTERNRILNQRTEDLLNQECVFAVKKVTLDQEALEKALERESSKSPKEIRSVCPECGALVQRVDPERNILNARDLGHLSDYIEIKKLNKKKGKK